ncbi:MAG: phosphomannomutase/phosphoglucomutase [Halobacteria archaeon]|nr:phosphomannomutase/phosphoglucomutase [Halobacteria archaeon]
MTSFFHAYDLRGKYPDEIGPEEARNVGKAFGTFVDSDEVLIGRDGRLHADEITDAFIDGVLSTGTNVIYAGMVPTPVVYFGMVENDIDYSAVVTASHNPPEYTGFKFCRENALAMSREGGMAEIEGIYTEEDYETGKGVKTNIELVDDYVGFVKDRIELEEELNIAVNFGNGVTGVTGRKLLEEIGCELETINEEIDGRFPNHLPAPTQEKAQEQLMEIMDRKDLGVLFDGDGDRAGFVLPKTGYIEGDKVLAVFAEECLKIEKGKVVHDLMTSKLVPERIEKNGGEPVETRVGHTFISERIHSDSDIVFAGELSGHYYFPVFDMPWDDGLFSATLMCQTVSRRDVDSLVSSFPKYPVSPELRIDCPHGAKQEVVDRIADYFSDHEISTIDGVKIYFDRGWALVRPSNTEPKMSVRCEADTQDALKEIREKVETKVRTYIEEAT